MAISIAFGVLFATLVSLILVPSTYHILHDLQRGYLWFSTLFVSGDNKKSSVAEEVDKSFDANTEDVSENERHYDGYRTSDQ